MFGQRKANNSCEQQAEDVYRVVLMRALEPIFYERYNVPDSFEGRFDLLLLHVFFVMHVTLQDARGESFNQALFDVMFQDMDQSLREGGKGDMGVPKQMKRMMRAFNGRMNRYEEAYSNDFAAALRDNLYCDIDIDDATLNAIIDYTQRNIEALNAESILSGEITLEGIEGL